jgi:hypothetical protein
VPVLKNNQRKSNGRGCYNLAQGAIATVHGIGASLSGLAAGVIVDHFGYSSAFLALAAAAVAALTVFALGMPETADRATVSLLSPLLAIPEVASAVRRQKRMSFQDSRPRKPHRHQLER